MEFSRQEYWSGLPFPSPGDLPNPGIEPRSLAFQADGLTSEPPGKPQRKEPNNKARQSLLRLLASQKDKQLTYLLLEVHTPHMCVFFPQNKNLNQIKILNAKYKGHGNISNEVEIQTKTNISKIKFLVRV